MCGARKEERKNKGCDYDVLKRKRSTPMVGKEDVFGDIFYSAFESLCVQQLRFSSRFNFYTVPFCCCASAMTKNEINHFPTNFTLYLREIRVFKISYFVTKYFIKTREFCNQALIVFHAFFLMLIKNNVYAF